VCVLGAVLVIVGSIALHDPTESYVVVGGVAILFAACVRYTITTRRPRAGSSGGGRAYGGGVVAVA
jgi:hypothetical protein